MSSRVLSFYQRYLLPGFVFQSIIIAGGYGTGRELVEFFLRRGPIGGLLGLLLPVTMIMSVCCAIAFELARRTHSYDYRAFLGHLLGPGWFLYEIGYLTAILLILAVIGSAAGTFLEEAFCLPGTLGGMGMLVCIGFLVFRGTRVIEGAMSVWSFVLYAVYLTLFVWSFVRFGPAIREHLAAGGIERGWMLSGVRYSALGVSLIPAMLFATAHIERRREAIVAGLLAGPIGTIPAVLFFLAIVAHYPTVLERPVPANFVLEMLGSRWFQIAYQIMLFGTLIETGTGLIHAFNERLAGVLVTRGRTLPPVWRPVVAVLLLGSGWLLSRIGIIALIARGYGAMTWYFTIVLIVPLLTVGMWRIWISAPEAVRAGRSSAGEPA